MLRELAGVRLTFFQWMLVAFPLAILMLLLCWTILTRRYRIGRTLGDVAQEYLKAEHARLGRWGAGERNVFAVFVLAVTLWVLPGALALLTSPDAAIPRFFERRLPEAMIALLAAVLLFILPADLRAGRFTLSWQQAVDIDWGTILLFGGGLSLGRLMFETKLAAILGSGIVRLSGAGVGPVPPVLGATLGAGHGFMLPVSTPPNAIVYGTGFVPLRQMVRSGIRLDILGPALIWVGLRVLCPLLGLL